MYVESVGDSGHVVVRFPGGWAMEFSVSKEIAPSYRRIVGIKPS